MLYCSRLVGGSTLHIFLVWLKFAKFYKLSSLCVKFKLLGGYPNHQRPCGNKKVLPTNIVVTVTSDLWPGLLFLKSSSTCPTTPRIQKYVVLHQVGWWACPSVFHFGSDLPLSLLVELAPSEWYDLLRLANLA